MKKKNKKRIKILIITIGLSLGLVKLNNSSDVLKKVVTEVQNEVTNLTSEQEDELYITEIEPSTENSSVLLALDVNENLTEEEKETINKFVNLLNDNEYLDKESAYKSLKKLNIIYTNRNPKYSDTTMGIYLIDKDLIEIFNKSSETLRHELIHCIYSNNKTKFLPDYLSEGMTEILSNEYFESNPFQEEKSYPFEIAITKTLCEMVGSNKVLESFSTGKMSVIEKELENTMDSKSTKQFLSNLNSMFTEYSKYGYVTNTYQEVYNYMDTFFTNNYQDDEEKLKIYLYNKEILKLLNTSDPGTSYLYYLVSNGTYVKPYFSSSLKEKYPNTYFINYYEGENIIISSAPKEKKINW